MTDRHHVPEDEAVTASAGETAGRSRPGIISRILGALGCLLLLAVVVGVLAVMAGVGFALERLHFTPEDAVRAYVNAAHDREMRRAYETLCDDLRDRYTEQTLGREIDRQHSGLGPIQEREIDVTLPTAEGVRFRVLLRGIADSRVILVTAVQEGLLTWRVCRFDYELQ